MKDEKEIQTAWQLWILIEKLSTLLWDRYEKEFFNIDLKQQ